MAVLKTLNIGQILHQTEINKEIMAFIGNTMFFIGLVLQEFIH